MGNLSTKKGTGKGKGTLKITKKPYKGKGVGKTKGWS